MSHRYTPEQLGFLKRGYKRMYIPELTRAFNERFRTQLSAVALKATLTRHRIFCGRRPGARRGPRLFTAKQVAFIRRGYRTMNIRKLHVALCAKFGLEVGFNQLRAFINNHHIQCGRDGKFAKGLLPWNKGTHFTSGGRSAETRFKKGAKPQTWVPVGTEVRDRDGYLKRKMRDDSPCGFSRHNWKFVHVLLWEEHHGPVPDGHAIIFRNGARTDIRLDNLVLVTRAELFYLNRHGIAHLPEQIHPSAVALARLEVKRYELEHSTGERRNPC